MKTKEAYNHWASTYDSVVNKTRDLEAIAAKKILKGKKFGRTLEIGCGTGKNTRWLASRSRKLTAVDFSEEMLSLAKQKNKLSHVHFKQANITKPWSFKKVDLITCSLVLEHIENISFVFKQAFKTLKHGGLFYICELHPFKQLQGSRAKFETDGGTVQLEYFIHHLSEFFQGAKKAGFICLDMQEWFDSKNKNVIPRLCSFVFKKK
jgi:2-polyprenyl-3-methyl-5-hydroxy-6-metoxy-1,4-benzoquinol methylase